MTTFPPRCGAKFRAERLIASGGFGSVHLARQVALDRLVAIKLLDPARLEDATEVARFLDEARVTATLGHPGIVILIDHDVEDGVPWIAYEYAPGRSLREMVARGPLELRQALAITVQVADALHVAHDRGVVHRDIKPENVLEVDRGRVKVADFGIAKWSSGSVRTADGLILGTPAYLAPEQVLGEPASPRTDLYALGVMLHELLTGRTPFGGGDPIATMKRHLSEDPPRLALPGAPRALQHVLDRLLAKRPEERYASAAEVSIDTSKIMDAIADRPGGTRATPRAGGRATSAATVSSLEPAVAPGASRAVLLALAAGALGLALLGRAPVSGPPPPVPAPAVPSKSPSPAPAGPAAVVARFLPDFRRAGPADARRAAGIARACLRAVSREAPAAGLAGVPVEMLRCLVDVLWLDVHALIKERSYLLDEAQRRQYLDLLGQAADLGDALLRRGVPVQLELGYARVARSLFDRKLSRATSGEVESRLLRRVQDWRAAYPDAIAPRVMEVAYDLERGHKNRIASKWLALLTEYARVHLPPSGPAATIPVVEEWYTLLADACSCVSRARTPQKVADLAALHALTIPRFGPLAGHRAEHRQIAEGALAGGAR